MKHLLLFLLIGANFITKAQDSLVFQTGEIIPVKIIEKSPAEIKYKKYSYVEGPVFIANTTELKEIRFENGRKEFFSFNTKENTPATKDYFVPFHNSSETQPQTVRKTGTYFSFGIGSGASANYRGISSSVSLSVAHKSHVFSISRGSVFLLAAEVGGQDPYFNSQHFDFLFGESYRFKHSFLSLSTGVSASQIMEYHTNGGGSGHGIYNNYYGVSFPIEMKLFLLARNGIGGGLQISENIVPHSAYSQFAITLSLVLGIWNN